MKKVVIIIVMMIFLIALVLSILKLIKKEIKDIETKIIKLGIDTKLKNNEDFIRAKKLKPYLSKLDFLRNKDEILLEVETQEKFIGARKLYPFLSKKEFLKRKVDILLELENNTKIVIETESPNKNEVQELLRVKNKFFSMFLKLNFLRNIEMKLLKRKKEIQAEAERKIEVENEKRAQAEAERKIKVDNEKRVQEDAEKERLAEVERINKIAKEKERLAEVQRKIQIAKTIERLAEALRKTKAANEKRVQEEAEKEWLAEVERKNKVENGKRAKAEDERKRINALIATLPNTYFTKSKREQEYKWHSIYDYFPKSRYDISELTLNDIDARKKVYDFKDGRFSDYNAKIFSAAMIKEFGYENLKSKTIVIIPASTGEKTKDRFYEFCKKLCEIINAENGYFYIANNGNDREPTHRTGISIDLEEYVELDKGEIYNKDIIVIDDVRTRGNSSDTIYRLLENCGASNVTFVYLAKTVWN